MGRARLAAAKDSIRLRARPQHAWPRRTGMKTPRRKRVEAPGHRGELARRAFHESRVSRTIRRLQSPSHKRQVGDVACRMLAYSECAAAEGRRRRPHATRHTRHGTTRSRTGLPERARGVSPAAHRIALPGQAAHCTATRRAPARAQTRDGRADVAQRSRANTAAVAAAVACVHTTAKG